jgi:hypothetical protein
MESLVLLHTLLVAVFYIFTGANGSQNIAAGAPLANADCQLLILLERKTKLLLFVVSEFADDVLLVRQA